jgi:ribulose-5-phosphate 4-epimerase/fuculose-1-phosphate aldolase
VEPLQLESQFIDGCRRLAAKSFLNTSADSFSMRIPGRAKMLFASGLEDWKQIEFADIHATSLFSGGNRAGLHAAIYQNRADAGAVAISSPEGARLLAKHGGLLPPLFDEQVRHIGASAGPLPDAKSINKEILINAFRQGENAALAGKQLLCLGMTCDRVLFNAELYDKCARAYVIARESGGRIERIPLWVRLIANHRLLRNERDAAASYRNGRMPEGISAY